MSYKNNYSRDIFEKLKRYDVDEETGCWVWNGSKTKRGYGQCRFMGKPMYVHRLVAELFIGPLKKGKCGDVAHHKCGNQLCINPDHIEIKTQEDHTREHMLERWRIVKGGK